MKINDEMIDIDDVFDFLDLPSIGMEQKERSLKKVIGYCRRDLLPIYIMKSCLSEFINVNKHIVHIKNLKLIGATYTNIDDSPLIKIIPDRDPFSQDGASINFLVGFIKVDGREPQYVGRPLIYQDTYCKRKDIETVKANIAGIDLSKNKSSRQIKTPVGERRIKIFSMYLIIKSEIQPDDNAKFTHQKCYVKIGSPTRDHIWEELSMIDRELFSFGQDDFFASGKTSQKIVDFQNGTGKGRVFTKIK